MEKEIIMEEKFGVAEQLLEAVRNGIDAARFFARHEAISGMTSDDQQLVELASAVEDAAADLDETMLALLDHLAPEGEQDQAN
jgi:hypothetical protein